jgi:hypothetical protein
MAINRPYDSNILMFLDHEEKLIKKLEQTTIQRE